MKVGVSVDLTDRSDGDVRTHRQSRGASCSFLDYPLTGHVVKTEGKKKKIKK